MEDESRRRRGCDVETPWKTSRVGAAAATRPFRGDNRAPQVLAVVVAAIPARPSRPPSTLAAGRDAVDGGTFAEFWASLRDICRKRSIRASSNRAGTKGAGRDAAAGCRADILVATRRGRASRKTTRRLCLGYALAVGALYAVSTDLEVLLPDASTRQISLVGGAMLLAGLPGALFGGAVQRPSGEKASRPRRGVPREYSEGPDGGRVAARRGAPRGCSEGPGRARLKSRRHRRDTGSSSRGGAAADAAGREPGRAAGVRRRRRLEMNLRLVRGRHQHSKAEHGRRRCSTRRKTGIDRYASRSRAAPPPRRRASRSSRSRAPRPSDFYSAPSSPRASSGARSSRFRRPSPRSPEC